MEGLSTNPLSVLRPRCLSILEHVADPPLVSNCSAAVLRCRLDTSGPNIEVWWTFHGENASKLPNVVLIPPPSREAKSADLSSSSVAPHTTTLLTTTPAPSTATPSNTTTTTTTTTASGLKATSAVPNSTSSSLVTLPPEETSGAEQQPLSTTPGGDVFSGEDAENVTTAAPTTLSSEAASSEVESSSAAEVREEEEKQESSVWTLRLDCPTLEHAGSYACYALSRNASEFIYKKEASLDVYVTRLRFGIWKAPFFAAAAELNHTPGSRENSTHGERSGAPVRSTVWAHFPGKQCALPRQFRASAAEAPYVCGEAPPHTAPYVTFKTYAPPQRAI
ncbi:hypothetical protein HPB48_026189 [Haemaphysalis longicornis]|uniref:Ig-like domain-containing protein n=1 Tax=Haemaphysalis longicornis TaxID=44386 RepID=A0A9J6HA67_HAELO|nr:hypothetical protein HPB48_026189 [Haemaphysalis longicornis]